MCKFGLDLFDKLSKEKNMAKEHLQRVKVQHKMEMFQVQVPQNCTYLADN